MIMRRVLLVAYLFTATGAARHNEATLLYKGRQERQIHVPFNNSDPRTTAVPTDPLTSWVTLASTSRPNVLLLVVDDLRPKLGCYGDDTMVTPNIDQLASKSVLFNRAYAQQAVCGPSRTSFLTGRRPDTTRVLDLVTYWRTVAGNFTTLPEFFKQQGYRTQSVGKIFHPGVVSGNDYDAPYSWTDTPYPGYPEVDPDVDFDEYHKSSIQPVDEASEGKLQDTDMADFTAEWLQNHTRRDDTQPFFLAVGFHKPHLPFRYPKQFEALYPLSNITLAEHRVRPSKLPAIAWSNYGELRKFQDIIDLNVSNPYGPIPEFYQYKLRQAYSAATSYSDYLVGRVLAALEDEGLSQNTIIVFLGDHGWQLGENGEWSKHTNFEIAARIPLLVYVPGVTASTGRHFQLQDTLAARPGYHARGGGALVTDAIVEAVDLFPTLSELAGLPVPSTCPEDSLRVPTCTEGTSLVPLMQGVLGHNPNAGTTQWKDAAYSQFHRNLNSDQPIMGYTVRTAAHRYTEWVAYDKAGYQANFSHVYARELYVEASDPEEFNNVAEVTSYSDVVGQLSQLLHRGWRHTLDSLRAA